WAEACNKATSRDVQDYWHYDDKYTAGAEWTGLVSSLQANGVRVFAYKWPTQLEISAAGADLQTRVRAAIQAGSLGPKVVFVGHSMGGLVSLTALTGGAPLRNETIRVVTLSTPHQGTNSGWLGLWAGSRSVLEVQP